MKNLTLLTVFALALVLAGPMLAGTIFQTSPLTQVVHPGDSGSFSYTITNSSAVAAFWMVVDMSDSILGVPGSIVWDQSMFPLPIIAPGGSDTGVFASFQIDPAIPGGAGTFSGNFGITYSLWDGDPFSGGSPVNEGLTDTSPYDVTVRPNDAPVPEPSSALFLLGGGGLLLALRRRKK